MLQVSTMSVAPLVGETDLVAGVDPAQHHPMVGVVGAVALRGELCHPACRGRCIEAAVVHREHAVRVVADDLGAVEHDGVVVDLEAVAAEQPQIDVAGDVPLALAKLLVLVSEAVARLEAVEHVVVNRLDCHVGCDPRVFVCHVGSWSSDSVMSVTSMTSLFMRSVRSSISRSARSSPSRPSKCSCACSKSSASIL